MSATTAKQGETFDLRTTYASLDGQGRVARHPVGPDFWATINVNKALLPTMIGIYESDADWPHWEIHPEGDELLFLVEGEVTLALEEDGKERRVPFAPGQAFLIPRGVKHRALVARPSKILGITFGAGTTHVPLKKSR